MSTENIPDVARVRKIGFLRWQKQSNSNKDGSRTQMINLLVFGYVREFNTSVYNIVDIIKIIVSYSLIRFGVIIGYQPHNIGHIEDILDKINSTKDIYLGRDRIIAKTIDNKILITGYIYGDSNVVNGLTSKQWVLFNNLKGDHNKYSNTNCTEEYKLISNGKSGTRTTLILCTNNRMYCFGGNGYGQCGNGLTRNPDRADPNPKVYEWKNNTLDIFGGNIIKICCGQFTQILVDNGRVYGCGCNLDGRCGVDSRHNVTGVYRNGGKNCIIYPTMIKKLEKYKIVDISVGYAFTICVSAKGQVFSWGANWYGQCCIDNNNNNNNNDNDTLHERLRDLGGYNNDDNNKWIQSPTLCEALSDYNIVKVDCGVHHSVVIDEKGQCLIFGANECGQIGNGQVQPFSRYKFNKYLFQSALNGDLKNVKVEQGTAGYSLTLILTDDNKLYFMGAGLQNIRSCTPLLLQIENNNDSLKIVEIRGWHQNTLIFVQQ